MNRIHLLLADPSTCLRYRVLVELLGLPEDDPEVQELSSLRLSDPLLEGILPFQEGSGSWQPGSLAGGRQGSRTLVTALALTRLGYLGFDRSHEAVQRGAEWLFSRQLPDGSWPLEDEIALTDGSGQIPRDERYNMIPLQTAFPLRGLSACGYAQDPRAEKAYEWLLAQRLEDGAWPTGTAAGVYGFVGGYRRMPHSRWGCRSNTTGALICLANHPSRRTSPEARRALDLLLGRETRDAYALGWEVKRMVGAEPTQGFFTYFARSDPALLLDLSVRAGASVEDERLADLVGFIRGLQGEYGLWQAPGKPQASHWLTFDLLRSLSQLSTVPDWVNLEARSPFQAYPRRPRRF